MIYSFVNHIILIVYKPSLAVVALKNTKTICYHHNFPSSSVHILVDTQRRTIYPNNHKLHSAVASDIAAFNDGAIYETRVLRKRYIVPNEVMNMYREKLDNIRSSKSLLATLGVAKRRRMVKLPLDRSERHKENAAEDC